MMPHVTLLIVIIIVANLSIEANSRPISNPSDATVIIGDNETAINSTTTGTSRFKTGKKFVDHELETQEHRLSLHFVTSDSSPEQQSVPLNEEELGESESSDNFEGSDATPSGSSQINGEQSISLDESRDSGSIKPQRRVLTSPIMPRRIIINLDQGNFSSPSMKSSKGSQKPTTRLTIGLTEQSNEQRDSTDAHFDQAADFEPASRSRRSKQTVSNSLEPETDQLNGFKLMNAIKRQGGIPTVVMHNNNNNNDNNNERQLMLSSEYLSPTSSDGNGPSSSGFSNFLEDRDEQFESSPQTLASSFGLSQDDELSQLASGQNETVSSDSPSSKSSEVKDLQSMHQTNLKGNNLNGEESGSRPQRGARRGGVRPAAPPSSSTTTSTTTTTTTTTTSTTTPRPTRKSGPTSRRQQPPKSGHYRHSAEKPASAPMENNFNFDGEKGFKSDNLVMMQKGKQSGFTWPQSHDFAQGNKFSPALEQADLGGRSDQFSNQEHIMPSVGSKFGAISMGTMFGGEQGTSEWLGGEPNGKLMPNQHHQQQNQATPIAEVARFDDHSIAQLLEHLKLYTTKDQLLKVARELEGMPGNFGTALPSQPQQMGKLDSQPQPQTQAHQQVQQQQQHSEQDAAPVDQWSPSVRARRSQDRNLAEQHLNQWLSTDQQLPENLNQDFKGPSESQIGHSEEQLNQHGANHFPQIKLPFPANQNMDPNDQFKLNNFLESESRAQSSTSSQFMPDQQQQQQRQQNQLPRSGDQMMMLPEELENDSEHSQASSELQPSNYREEHDLKVLDEIIDELIRRESEG